MTTTGSQTVANGRWGTGACVLVALLAAFGCKRSTKTEPTSQSAAATTVPLGNGPAASQFAAWLAAFNAGDRAGLLAYHEQSFPYAVASDDVAGIERELGLSHGTGGFDVTKTETSPTAITVTMKERHSPRFARATMEVDAAEPHRVVRFDIHPMPDEFQSEAERAAPPLDAAKRRALLDAIKQDIRAHYVIPEVGAKMIAALADHEAHGGYEGAADGPAFASLVMEDLRAASHDRHIRLEFGPPQPSPGQQTREQLLAEERAINFGFGTIERLPGNVAHVVIDGFPRVGPDLNDAVGGFMTQIADADALLVDLRHNHGGDPHTVAVVASYLFDGRVHLNDMLWPEQGTTEEFWTMSDVKGTRFGSKKPLYVLTSHETFSGGEEFAYDIQALKRGVIVGETTGGGAHPTDAFDLDDWYHFIVPVGRPINPITKTDWEGVGVVPDVPVSADAALEEARRRAVEDVARTKPAGDAR
jgi:hypothetical protein